ncbi:MAG: J domain-containing protein [Methyloligellaceae bacterium]
MLSNNQSYKSETRAIPVRIIYDDGTKAEGSILIPKLSDFTDLLSSCGPFLNFLSEEGDKSFIATGKIRTLEILGVPKVKALDSRKRESENPYTILGVAANAGEAEIKKAFHSKSKEYHPDRFMAVDPPAEIVEYLNAMTQAINYAYSVVIKNAPKSEKVSA